MLLHSHRYRRLENFLLLSLLQLLLDRPLVPMQPIELLKADNALQVGSILLKLPFDVGLQLGVDIVGAFADQPCIEDQQHCLFGLADETKPRKLFLLPFCVSDWI